MTRSIPSIIVLSLMCFTISYGLVRFPDAGILDAAPNTALSSTDNATTCTSMKMPTDGTELLQDESASQTALPETEATSDDLFVTQQTTPPVKEVAESKVDNDASAKEANKAQENKKKKSNKGGNKSKENKKTSDNASTADIPADKPENVPEKSESKESDLPNLESETVNSAADNDEFIELIGVPDNDKSTDDDSLPIKTDVNPIPAIDPITSDIPSVIVDHDFGASEPGPLSDSDDPIQEDISIPEMAPESNIIDDLWNDNPNENVPSGAATSNVDNAPTDNGNASISEEQTTKAPEPTTIKTDPNAQEIPPRNREPQPVNQGALTLPALDEPQNVNPNPNQPNTGTIPLESFPLDASAAQRVNYTVQYQQEPHDSLGFNIPASGPIVVKRLPSIENSVDPIYNNAQLDRFAL